MTIEETKEKIKVVASLGQANVIKNLANKINKEFAKDDKTRLELLELLIFTSAERFKEIFDFIDKETLLFSVDNFKRWANEFCDFFEIVQALYFTNPNLKVNIDAITILFKEVYSAKHELPDYKNLLTIFNQNDTIKKSNISHKEFYEALITTRNLEALKSNIIIDDDFTMKEFRTCKDFLLAYKKLIPYHIRENNPEDKIIQTKIINPLANAQFLRLIRGDKDDNRFRYLLRILSLSSVPNKVDILKEAVAQDKKWEYYYETLIKAIIQNGDLTFSDYVITLMEEHDLDYDWSEVEYYPTTLSLVILESDMISVINKYLEITNGVKEVYWGTFDSLDSMTACALYFKLGDYEKAMKAFQDMDLYYHTEDCSYEEELTTKGKVRIGFLEPALDSHLNHILWQINYSSKSEEEKRKVVESILLDDKVLFIHNEVIGGSLRELYKDDIGIILNKLYDRYLFGKIKFLVNKNDCIWVASDEEVTRIMAKYQPKGMMRVRKKEEQ